MSGVFTPNHRYQPYVEKIQALTERIKTATSLASLLDLETLQQKAAGVNSFLQQEGRPTIATDFSTGAFTVSMQEALEKSGIDQDIVQVALNYSPGRGPDYYKGFLEANAQLERLNKIYAAIVETYPEITERVFHTAAKIADAQASAEWADRGGTLSTQQWKNTHRGLRPQDRAPDISRKNSTTLELTHSAFHGKLLELESVKTLLVEQKPSLMLNEHGFDGRRALNALLDQPPPPAERLASPPQDVVHDYYHAFEFIPNSHTANDYIAKYDELIGKYGKGGVVSSQDIQAIMKSAKAVIGASYDRGIIVTPGAALNEFREQRSLVLEKNQARDAALEAAKANGQMTELRSGHRYSGNASHADTWVIQPNGTELPPSQTRKDRDGRILYGSQKVHALLFT